MVKDKLISIPAINELENLRATLVQQAGISSEKELTPEQICRLLDTSSQILPKIELGSDNEQALSASVQLMNTRFEGMQQTLLLIDKTMQNRRSSKLNSTSDGEFRILLLRATNELNELYDSVSQTAQKIRLSIANNYLLLPQTRQTISRYLVIQEILHASAQSEDINVQKKLLLSTAEQQLLFVNIAHSLIAKSRDHQKLIEALSIGFVSLGAKLKTFSMNLSLVGIMAGRDSLSVELPTIHLDNTEKLDIPESLRTLAEFKVEGSRLVNSSRMVKLLDKTLEQIKTYVDQVALQEAMNVPMIQTYDVSTTKTLTPSNQICVINNADTMVNIPPKIESNLRGLANQFGYKKVIVHAEIENYSEGQINAVFAKPFKYSNEKFDPTEKYIQGDTFEICIKKNRNSQFHSKSWLLIQFWIFRPIEHLIYYVRV